VKVISPNRNHVDSLPCEMLVSKNLSDKQRGNGT